MVKVLFVCLGNICRSPMAEGLMKKRLTDLGMENSIHVESRATSSYEIGRRPHKGTLAILERESASLPFKTAKRITKEDIASFDYVIGMDQDNVRDLKMIAGINQNKVYLMRDIHDKTRGEDIPDPYYSGRYEETYQLISESIEHWLDHLKKTQ